MGEDPVAIMKLAVYALKRIEKCDSVYQESWGDQAARHAHLAVDELGKQLQAMTVATGARMASETPGAKKLLESPSVMAKIPESPARHAFLRPPNSTVKKIEEHRQSLTPSASEPVEAVMNYTIQCCARTTRGAQCKKLTSKTFNGEPRCVVHSNLDKYKSVQSFYWYSL